MLRFYIPDTPPTVNSMYSNVRGKGRVKTKRYLNWCKTAGWEVKAQQGHQGKLLDGKYGLIVKIHRRSNADLSNYMKPIEDLLVGLGITPDDCKNIFPLPIDNPKKGVEITVLDEVEAYAAKYAMEIFENNLR